LKTTQKAKAMIQLSVRKSLPLFALLLRLLAATLCFFTASAHAESPADNPWGNSYFPNVPLVTQDGKTVRFYDDLIKDKVVAINFIFTTCSLACPLETAKIKQVQKLLGDRVGRDVFLYSITIDPLNDTPEVLKSYAKKFNVGPGWTFLTGKPDDITLLRQTLGLYIPVVDAKDSGDHNLSLIIGNQKTGRWQKANPFENPYILANLLGASLHNWKDLNPTRNDYVNAPTKLRPISHGEELFRTRCAACHTLGAPADSLAALRSIGPDLGNVTKTRERSWLTRWIMEPDRMLAEKDPIAIQLFERYNKIAMPNLKLNQNETHDLLEYLGESSAERGEQMARE
jgi:protein SCO1